MFVECYVETGFLRSQLQLRKTLKYKVITWIYHASEPLNKRLLLANFIQNLSAKNCTVKHLNKSLYNVNYSSYLPLILTSITPQGTLFKISA